MVGVTWTERSETVVWGEGGMTPICTLEEDEAGSPYGEGWETGVWAYVDVWGDVTVCSSLEERTFVELDVWFLTSLAKKLDGIVAGRSPVVLGAQTVVPVSVSCGQGTSVDE